MLGCCLTWVLPRFELAPRHRGFLEWPGEPPGGESDVYELAQVKASAVCWPREMGVEARGSVFGIQTLRGFQLHHLLPFTQSTRLDFARLVQLAHP